jgi:hypothetical protein
MRGLRGERVVAPVSSNIFTASQPVGYGREGTYSLLCQDLHSIDTKQYEPCSC